MEGIRVNVERSLANDLLMQFRSIGAGAPPPVTDNMFQDWKHYIDRDFRIYAEEARSTPFGKSVSNGRAHRGCLTVMGIFLYCHMDETYLETIIKNENPTSEIITTCAKLIDAELFDYA